MAASSKVAFAFILIVAVLITSHASPSSKARKHLVGTDKLIDRPRVPAVKASALPSSFVKNRECVSLKPERALEESVPSPGQGHRGGALEESVPSPGQGHRECTSLKSKRALAESVPSPGQGHRGGALEESVPSPGQGHRECTSLKSKRALEESVPSPGQGHRPSPVQARK
ncbi:hypothetical protein BT93_F2634 [Corymbia citriodora subsp. variegata]|nr:hypothetical protein BT93_F2634 [Corymbia citriodora subsp. variegata]